MKKYTKILLLLAVVLTASACKKTTSEPAEDTQNVVESDAQPEIEVSETDQFKTEEELPGILELGLAVLSMETGAVLQEVTLFGFEIPDVQLCGDMVAVTDWGDGKVLLLDETLATVKEYQAPAANCAIYVSPDAAKIYSFTQENGVKITDIESGNTEVLLENAAMLYANDRCKDMVSVSYTDKETQLSENVIVDLANGTAETIPFTGAFYNVECSDGVWLAGVLGEENTYYLGRSERPNSFQPYGESSMVTMLSDPTRLMAITYDEAGIPAIMMYEADGRFLSQCRLSVEGAGLYDDPVWSEAGGGYFFIVTDAAGKDMLLFWDMAVPVTGMDLQLTSEQQGETEESVVSQELYDRAAGISDKYGIEVKFAEQCDKEYRDYTVRLEMDEDYISSALDTLETVLSAYPEGFMEQLVFGTQKEIELHLTGTLTPKEMSVEEGIGFTSFCGFASQEEGKNLIVLDISYPGSLAQSLYHEIAHLIDFKLEFDAGMRDGALYSEEGWKALNPDGFAYADKKAGLPESIYNDGYETWFIDIYSRTTIREDRARIMEYAMIQNDWVFSASPGRLAKLEYLSDCIRDSFDTAGWPQTTVWEETLAKSGRRN